MTQRSRALDKGTAVLCVLALLFGLAAVNDWSGIAALFVGIAFGVANADDIKEFFR